ncbi:MAG: DUF1015 domain-containing protein [Candidatus Ancaeobacter aquaticus]|nr:DUF1015 domain-containing protein [Candidatus Ancaeobacter aquaticus]
MAEIKPFRGMYYNRDKVDIKDVVTQPYDKIKPTLQDEYYARSPYNFVQLILNKIASSDTEDNNRYTRARELFKKWQDEEVLKQDDAPTIYIYEQTYTTPLGEKKMRRGFISLLRLAELGKGGVYPHEQTLSKPKADRFELIKKCNTNFEQIFMLYNDKDVAIKNVLDIAPTTIMFDFCDEYGVGHVLKRVDDSASANAVCDGMSDKKIFIADGHHRYEVALNYRDYLIKEQGIGSDHDACFRVAYFVSMESDGLTVLPTHRMVKNMDGFTIDNFIATSGEYFEIVKIDDAGSEDASLKNMLDAMSAGQREGKNCFGVAGKGVKYLLTLKEEIDVKQLIGKDMSDVVSGLDVTILHRFIIEKILGISQEKVAGEDNLSYVRDPIDGVQGVNEGLYQVTFFLNPTKVDEVRAVAQSGEKMPQKSTDFYPKVSSGLVMYTF